MINDPRGDKSLELICKGLVFNNQQQYEDGYREQILNKITAIVMSLSWGHCQWNNNMII